MAKSAGFSLVEVLVSVVVLTIGLLGMVGMQAAAMQANREARAQSVAMSLARDLADMVRGNKAIGALTTANPYVGSFSTPPLVVASPSYCLNMAAGTTTCASPTEVANAQMTEWLTRVENELPGARVAICFDTAPFDASGLPQWACTAPAVGATGAVLVIKMGWTQSAINKALSGASAVVRASDSGAVPAVVVPVTAGL